MDGERHMGTKLQISTFLHMYLLSPIASWSHLVLSTLFRGISLVYGVKKNCLYAL